MVNNRARIKNADKENTMQVKMMRTNKLVPYANNPRDNSDAVEAVAASIREFGFKVPITCSTDNVVITGHTRLLAAKMLGMSTVPVIVLDIPEQKQREYRLADNRIGEFSTWELDMLKNELGEIKGIDMGDFGFIVDSGAIEDAADGGGFNRGGIDEDDGMVECPRCKARFRMEDAIENES